MMFALGILMAIAGAAIGISVFGPAVNRMFSWVWSDPTFTNRGVVAKRVKELMIGGSVPEETAVLMAAKEYGVTERELLEVANAFDPADLKALVTGGKRGALRSFSRALDEAIRKGSGRRRKK